MTGFDFKELLIDERVKFVDLALGLGIAPQTVQSRLHVKKVSLDFVAEVERYLGKESGYFARRHAEKMLGVQQIKSAEASQSNTERLITLLEKQSEQIGALISRIDRLIDEKK